MTPDWTLHPTFSGTVMMTSSHSVIDMTDIKLNESLEVFVCLFVCFPCEAFCVSCDAEHWNPVHCIKDLFAYLTPDFADTWHFFCHHSLKDNSYSRRPRVCRGPHGPLCEHPRAAQNLWPCGLSALKARWLCMLSTCVNRAMFWLDLFYWRKHWLTATFQTERSLIHLATTTKEHNTSHSGQNVLSFMSTERLFFSPVVSAWMTQI